MAEKLETILRRNTLNTRAKDFYDVYILHTTQSYDKAILREAVSATAAHRGTARQIANTPALLQQIAASAELRQMWEKYRREYNYAASITYEQIIEALDMTCAVLI